MATNKIKSERFSEEEILKKADEIRLNKEKELADKLNIAKHELANFLDGFAEKHGYTLGVRINQDLCIELIKHGFSGNYNDGKEIILNQFVLIPITDLKQG